MCIRDSLFYRLNVIRLELPPLRERPDDIPLLVRHFIARHSERHGRSVQGASGEVLSALQRWHWPGNVRELENLVERMVILAEAAQETAAVEMLPVEIVRPPAATAAKASPGSMRTQKNAYEKDILLQALERHHWNQSAVARELDIDEKSVRYKMKKFGIKKPGGI